MTQIATVELALHGGQPTIDRPAPKAKRWGSEELELLQTMMEQESLFYWQGPQTKLLVERFQKNYPLEHVMPCSSGTAAIHIAVLAAGIGPGDEVIVPPITDMGTVIGILYQGAVPVFAEVEAYSYNLDPIDVAKKITPKTKAIIAIHLTGNPCNLTALRAICDENDLVLIEDCAQAWGAEYDGAPIGTIGDIGCWSLNDFKHIGCGDGGVVASNHPEFGPRLQSCGDKSYSRGTGTRFPEMLAPNYRISEPQSAVAAAQMEKMPGIGRRRGELGRYLAQGIQDIPGIHPPAVRDEDWWTCWFFLFRVNPELLGCDAKEFASALAAEGVACGSGYIRVPIYKYPIFQNENFFAGGWPTKAAGLTDMDYKTVHCPETEAALENSIQIPISEAMDEAWIDDVIAAVRKVTAYYAGGGETS